jgi:hypothetical protein
VLPLAVLVILVWLARAGRAVVVTAAALAVAGVGYYAALLVTGSVSNTTWVLAPDDLVLHWPAALLLPDDRDLNTADQVRYAAWVVVAATTALLALRTARRSGRAPAASRTSR